MTEDDELLLLDIRREMAEIRREVEAQWPEIAELQRTAEQAVESLLRRAQYRY